MILQRVPSRPLAEWNDGVQAVAKCVMVDLSRQL